MLHNFAGQKKYICSGMEGGEGRGKLPLKTLSKVNGMLWSMGDTVVGLAALFAWVPGMDGDGGRALSLICRD